MSEEEGTVGHCGSTEEEEISRAATSEGGHAQLMATHAGRTDMCLHAGSLRAPRTCESVASVL